VEERNDGQEYFNKRPCSNFLGEDDGSEDTEELDIILNAAVIPQDSDVLR